MMSEPRIRTRFAPSPTGYLHIGGVRTALFCWLFARRHGGQFVLRIDDTDVQRNVDEVLSPILEGLKWLGIDWDEGPGVEGPHSPYYQSQRTEQYQQAVETLLAGGHAYRDFATSEEIQAEREAAQREKRTFRYSRRWMAESSEDAARFESEGRSSIVRLKMPHEGQMIINDLVRGRVEFDLAKEQDHVIQRADGTCLYHLASVVDDHDFEITHVIRAEEHLSNTPRQVFIAESLGYERPNYAHLPYVAEPGSKNKLSKRKLQKYLKNRDFAKLMDRGNEIARAMGLETSDETFNPVIVDFYEQIGYLPDAVVNYLLLLGWALDDHTEYFQRDEMIGHFSLEKVNKAPASFDPAKLNAFQARYMQVLPIKQKVALVLPYLQRAGLVSEPPPCDAGPKIKRIVEAAGDRIVVAGDILDYDYFFQDDDGLTYDEKALDKRLRRANGASVLREFRNRLSSTQFLTKDTAKEALKKTYETTFGPLDRQSNRVFHDYVEAVDRALNSGEALQTPMEFRADTIESKLLPTFVRERALSGLGDIVHAVRVAITGKAVGPSLVDCIEILGKPSCIRRIEHALALTGPVEPKLPERWLELPEPLFPVFGEMQPNENVLLHTGELTIETQSTSAHGRGSVIFEWQPSPAVRFDVQLNQFFDIHVDYAHVIARDLNTTFDALVTGSRLTQSEMELSGILTGHNTFGIGDELAYIVCHIPGFHDFAGQPIRHENAAWAGRAVFEVGGWKITLDALRDVRKRIARVKKEGGCAVTHIARLERSTGEVFNAKDVDSVLDAFQYYLSFARGYWVAPILLAGFDAQQEQVWSDWTLRKFDDWSPVTSWCPLHSFDDVVKGFNHFFERWIHPEFSDVISTAIYWYLQSTRGGAIDRSIITALIVIDLIADVATTSHGSANLREASTLSSRAARIVSLLELLGVESACPEEFGDLQEFASYVGARSAPEALMRLRDMYVHPNKEHRELFAETKQLEKKVYEAWRLSLWYCDLAILWTIGFDGRYVDRLSAHYASDATSTPWTKDAIDTDG